MDPFWAYFDFDGRLDRLGFAVRCLVVTAVAWILVSYGRSGVGFLLDGSGVFGVRTWSAWAQLLVLMAAAWATLALASRRLRDMGAEPAWVVPIWGVLCSVGVELGGPWTRLAPPPMDWVAAFLLPGLSAIPLLLWPSRSGRRDPAAATDLQSAQPTAYVDWRSPGRDD